MANLSDSQLANVVRQAGFPDSAQATAIAIALAESGGRTDAVNRKNSNGSIDYGLFQINSIHKDLLARGSWSDPVSNARMAFSVSSGGTNWKPWVVYKTGAYRMFLARATLASGSAGVTPIDTAPVNAATDTLQAVFDPHSYLRIGMFIFGGLLVFISVERSTGAVSKTMALNRKAVSKLMQVAVVL